MGTLEKSWLLSILPFCSLILELFSTGKEADSCESTRLTLGHSCLDKVLCRLCAGPGQFAFQKLMVELDILVGSGHGGE